MLITRLSHSLKGKEMQLFPKNKKKQIYIIQKVSLTEEIAVNYSTSKFLCMDSENIKHYSRKLNSKSSAIQHFFHFILFASVLQW